MARAEPHGLLPRLYWSLSASRALVPAAVFEELRERFHANARHNLLLEVELAALAALLAKHGIPVVALKGPALAALIHGRVPLREMSDLDLLVAPADLARAQSLILARGYRQQYPLSDREQAWHRRTAYATSLLKYDSDRFHALIVDLHWALTPRWMALPLGAALADAATVAVEVRGARLTTLAAEPTLLVLAVHGLAHRWDQLSLVADVAELVDTHPEIDWADLVARADRCGARRCLLSAVHLAHELYASALPAALPDDTRARALARSLAARLLSGDPAPAAGSLAAYRLMLASRERPRDRARMLARLLFEPRLDDYRFLALPQRLEFAYPAVRLARLATRPLR